MKKLMLILKTKKSLPNDLFSQILALEDGRILSKGVKIRFLSLNSEKMGKEN